MLFTVNMKSYSTFVYIILYCLSQIIYLSSINCQLSAPYELNLGHPLALPLTNGTSLTSSSSSSSEPLSSTLSTNSADLLGSKLKRSSSCGSEIHRSEGWIQSPNYPSNYPDSTYCSS
uniref:CUB domain-containing protein n=1 Tax=Tetranychus urticae TaxID=32264 RepID=T1KI85_TETUR